MTCRAGGVVSDPATWERVLHEVAASAESAGLHAHRAIRSPIAGGDGNVEFLLDVRRTPGDQAALETSVADALGGP